MRLKQEMEDVATGSAVSISVTDPGFVHDIPAWCNSTGNELLNVNGEKGVYTAVIVKRDGKSHVAGIASMAKHKTIVVFSADLDKVMAAFIIANGAASMGSEVSLFFTFWGLNVLRKTNGPSVKKSMVESLFSFMMPKGASKLGLSRMNFAGLGKRMMVDIMNKKNVAAVPELIQAAKLSGIKLIACSMTMDVMGIHAEELIDGVEIGGVAMYLDKAEAGNVNLFVG
jgi:peroxiredoxin family protein/TusA-related sulfurtransferase